MKDLTLDQAYTLYCDFMTSMERLDSEDFFDKRNELVEAIGHDLYIECGYRWDEENGVE